jgi:hypothetical protein
MTNASSVMQVLTIPSWACPRGPSIIGYNYGAGNTDR